MPEQVQSEPPGRILYVIPAALAVGGCFLFVSFLINSLSGMQDQLQQFKVPGEAEIQLPSAGAFTIFREKHTIYEGRFYASDEAIAGLECRVTRRDGNDVPLRAPRMNTSYTMGERSGESVFDLTVPAAGHYKIACDYPDSEKGATAIFAVGRIDVLTTVIVALGIGFGTLLGAGGVWALIWLKRNKATTA